MAPKKRAIASLDGVHAKRLKLGGLLAKLSEAEDTLRQSEQEEQDILAIVKELVASPGKLKGAKAAIMSDMFLKDEFELLHDSVVKLDRVPLKWFATSLSQMSADATDAALKGLKKVDKQVVARTFYFLTRTGPLDKVPCRDPQEFTKYFANRARQLNPDLQNSFNQILDKLSHGWGAIGHFQLCYDSKSGSGGDVESEKAAGCKGNGGQTSHVSWMGYRAPFPEYVSINDKWLFEGNWCIHQAKVMTPPGQKPKIEVNLKSLFPQHVAAEMSPPVGDWRMSGAGQASEQLPVASPLAARERKPASPKPAFDDKKFKNMVKKLKS